MNTIDPSSLQGADPQEEIKVLKEANRLAEIENKRLREKIEKTEESRDVFAMSFLVFALYDPRAVALRESHATTLAILNFYKDRSYIDPNPSTQ